MIAYLCGKTLQISAESAIVLCAGVGYQVFVPKPTLVRLSPGAEVELWVQSIIREDAHLLFGFLTTAEKECFLKLLQVNSVGPKLALSVLSQLSPDQLLGVVARGDLAMLTRIPGVGKKTAERLLLDLRGGLKGLSAEWAPAAGTGGIFADASEALIGLGYDPQLAQQTLQSLPQDLGLEDLIKAALKLMRKV